MVRWAVLLSSLVWTMACASVEVVKVPHAPSYVLDDECDGKEDRLFCWNEMRERADGIKGARYYLPRPYVAVKQEFPVGGGSLFVPGKIDKDNRVLSIDSQNLPKALRETFPGGQVGMGDIKKPAEAPVSAPATSTQSTSAGSTGTQTPSGGSGTAAPAPSLMPDNKNSLKDSTVSHSDVPSATTVITLKIKVAKDALAGDAFGQGPVLDDKKVYLVPFAQGKHTTEGLVTVEKIVSVQGKAGEDRLIEAQVEGSKVPAHASLGVGVEGSVDGARKSFVLHRPAVDLHSSFADAKKEEKKDEKTEDKKEGEKKVSKAEATVSGDPTTDPLIKISDLYDVLLLPDFSEQYAIQVRSGLFQASADIGLENGWMAEKLNFDIDNSAIGEFLLDSATKLVDAGIGKLFPAKAAVDQAQTQPSGATEVQSRQQGETVLLRIDFVEIAVPGLYPLVKAEEQECGFDQTGKPKGIAPCPPRIDWRTRTEWAVTLVTATSRAAGGTPAGTQDCEINQVIADAGFAQPQHDVAAFFTSGTVRVVGVTSIGPSAARSFELELARDSLAAPAQFEANRTVISEGLKEVLNGIISQRGCGEARKIQGLALKLE